MALLDSLKHPDLFVDRDHLIRYLSKAAMGQYEVDGKLLGRSRMSCHNEKSEALMHRIWSWLKAGEDEVLVLRGEEHPIYMRAVRDRQGNLLGY